MSFVSQNKLCSNMTTAVVGTADPINATVKEVERTFCFTDVPCGAIKFRKEEKKPVKEQPNDVATSFCGILEKTFCFTDLEDINEEDIQRIKTMVSLEQQQQQQEQLSATPAEAADTASESDDSVPTNTPGDVKSVQGSVKDGSVKVPDLTLKKSKPQEEALPKNAHQASKNTPRWKNGKPLNAHQAAKLAKKEKKKVEQEAKRNGKRAWGFFRKAEKTPPPQEPASPVSAAVEETEGLYSI